MRANNVGQFQRNWRRSRQTASWRPEKDFRTRQKHGLSTRKARPEQVRIRNHRRIERNAKRGFSNKELRCETRS